MKNPVNIFCFVSFPHQNDDSPTIFAPDTLSTSFLVTHGPDFVLGSFSASSNGTKAGNFDGSVLTESLSVVQPSPNVVENVLCPTGDSSGNWLEDTKNAKDSNVLSVENLGASGSKGMVMSTNFLKPLVLDQDHPFLSVGIVNYNNESPEYWAGLTWDLSSFLPEDDSIANIKEAGMTVYEIQYGNNGTTRCSDNAEDAVTFVRVSLDNITADDFPTVSCEAYHWLDRKIKNEKRTTTKVAAVLGSGLAVAVLVIIALGLVVFRQQRSQKASSSA
jgi:hypothetical protein